MKTIEILIKQSRVKLYKGQTWKRSLSSSRAVQNEAATSFLRHLQCFHWNLNISLGAFIENLLKNGLGKKFDEKLVQNLNKYISEVIFKMYSEDILKKLLNEF